MALIGCTRIAIMLVSVIGVMHDGLGLFGERINPLFQLLVLAQQMRVPQEQTLCARISSDNAINLCAELRE
jgi:hypothetical protein